MNLFAAPHWLVFLPVLLLLGWQAPRLGLFKPWRALFLLTILIAMARPQIHHFGAGLDLFVVVDQSNSAREALQPRQSEWEELLRNSKHKDDNLYMVDYAETAVARDANMGGVYPAGRDLTRTALAIRFALGRAQPDRATRLLLLTDGYATEPLGDIPERLRAQQVALDYRLLNADLINDYRAEQLTLPARVRLGEPYLVEAVVTGSPDGEVEYEISRDGGAAKKGKVKIENGRGVLRFTDQLGTPGAHKYALQVIAENDKRPGNNRIEAWVETSAGPRTVLITSYTNDPLAAALRQQGMPVQEVLDPATLNLGTLSGARAVIINNVPAANIPTEFLQAIDFFVNEQGGGLLMVGGKFAFGSGGYFQSSIDPLLPVSMELRQEHYKLLTAMCVVMDISGSMSAAVPGGAGGLMKINLAAEGAAKTIELLTPRDLVSVIGVDSSPHIVIPLGAVGNDVSKLTGPVRRIEVGGGGIYIDEAIKAGYSELQKTKVGQRHMVLFADACDSEQPGDYIKLITAMRKEDMTLSVIGMGKATDPDSKLLEDIAKRGGGRMFFCEDTRMLPAIFAQETVAVARSLFVQDPTVVKPVSGWNSLAAGNFQWLPKVDGYNLSYLKPEAGAGAITGDEYNAPLVAFWQRGAGRSAAITFPLGGEYSQSARAWPQYGDFVQTVVRWVAGHEAPPGTMIRTKLDGTDLKVELLYNSSWEEKISQQPPRVMIASSGDSKPREHAWERISPGRYQAIIPLQPSESTRGAIQIGGESVPFGPIIAGSGPEWVIDPARIQELQTTARLSGGGPRLDLAKIWDAPRASGLDELWPWFVWAAIAFLILDVLWTRLNWSYRMEDWMRAKRVS